MRRGGPAIAMALLALAAVAGCAAPAVVPTAPPSPAPPTPSVTPSLTPFVTPLPTPTPDPPPTPAPPTATPLGEAPSGAVLVDVPAAGLRMPVPAGWLRVDAEALGDPTRRDELASRYPGVSALLDAAASMGDRATLAFAAFDQSGGNTSLTPNIAVLITQPSVDGPLLDMVAGFVGDGLAEAFEAEETARERVTTPLGNAVRMEYALPPDGETALAAVEYLVGAPEGTLLVSVMGPAELLAGLDPDALVAALEPLP